MTIDAETHEQIVRDGVAAWARLQQDMQWADWLLVIRALQFGRGWAVQATESNARGSRYNAAFGAWLTKNGFDKIDSGDRTRALKVGDNLEAIEAWRSTLPANVRTRLNHPSSVLRRWQAA